MSLILWLKLALILFSIYSVIMYAIRRSENRGALHDLRDAPVVRQLSPEELAALQPFLLGSGLQITPEVRTLSGDFVRHGIEVQHSTTMHNTLGGVDVHLPYDAIEFLGGYNEAEVVLAAKGAVVVKLNGFDLVDAQARAQQRQDVLRDADPSDANTAHTAHAHTSTAPSDDPLARYRAGDIDVLGQRQETPEEAAARTNGPGLGGLPALGWLLAFFLLWMATWDATDAAHPYLLVAGWLLATGSFWLFLHQRTRQPEPQTVKRVRGLLNRFDILQVNLGVPLPTLFLGNSIKLVGTNWSKQLEQQAGKVIEAEIRSDDSSIVGLGQRWSITDEWQRFPPVFWGRHMLQAIVALLALLVLWLSGPDLRLEAALAWQQLRAGEATSYASAADVRAHPPSFGQLAQFKGSARCEITEATGMRSSEVRWPAVDCHTLRWDGEAPRVPDLELPPGMMALHNGSFLAGRADYRAATMLAIQGMLAQMGTGGDPVQRYLAQARAQQNAPVIVSVAQLLRKVDQACEEGLAVGQCQTLQQKVLGAFSSDLDAFSADMSKLPQPLTWEAMKAQTQGKERLDFVLSRNKQDELQTLARVAVNGELVRRLADITPALLASQRGGAVLRFGQSMAAADTATADRSADPSYEPPAYPSARSTADGTDAAPGHAQRTGPYLPSMPPGTETDDVILARYWPQLQQLGTPQAVGPFAVTGVVIAQGTDAAGTPWLEIDVQPAGRSSRGWSALAYTTWWLLALVLLIVHLALTVQKMSRSKRRNQALLEDIARRPAPGEPQVF